MQPPSTKGLDYVNIAKHKHSVFIRDSLASMDLGGSNILDYSV